MDLDSRNSAQVDSARTLSVFLGNPTRHLVVCSGVAIPNWDSQGSLDPLDVHIKLNVQATALLGWTAAIGLAGLSNDDTEFLFATDHAVAEIDASGELFLNAHIAVQGHPSVLRRFSYQTHLLITKDEPMISGVVSWSEAVATEAAGAAHRFTIAAGTNAPDGAFINYQVLVSGHEDVGASSPVAGNRRQVAYSLPVPIELLGTPLTMQASMFPGGLDKANPGDVLMVEQVGGANPVLLTNQHLVETGVDFAIVDFGEVK